MEIDELLSEMRARPMYYHRDGTPMVDNELLPATLQWALMFEDVKGRCVGNTRTLYGERLSTMWMGLDHSFFGSRPLIFETMLFAPKRNDAQRDRDRNRLMRMSAAARRSFETGEEWKLDEKDEEEKKDDAFRERFPHDQMQLRYHTENEAADMHEKLKWQCLIPPRWRHFLLWTIGQQEEWRLYVDDATEQR